MRKMIEAKSEELRKSAVDAADIKIDVEKKEKKSKTSKKDKTDKKSEKSKVEKKEEKADADEQAWTQF